MENVLRLLPAGKGRPQAGVAPAHPALLARMVYDEDELASLEVEDVDNSKEKDNARDIARRLSTNDGASGPPAGAAMTVTTATARTATTTTSLL